MVKLLVLVSLLSATVMAQRGRRPTSTAQQQQPTTARPAAPGSTQALWGQCGGQQWTGPTACPQGAFCSNDGKNVWYSQCIPLAAGQSSGAEVRTLTTAFTLDGPYPTVISTRITYLQPRPTSSSPVEVVTVTLTPDEPCDHDFYC